MYYYVFISQLSYKVQMRKLAFLIKKSNSIEQMKSFLFMKIKNKLAALSALQWSNHLIIPNNKLLNVTMYYLNMLDLEKLIAAQSITVYPKQTKKNMVTGQICSIKTLIYFVLIACIFIVL